MESFFFYHPKICIILWPLRSVQFITSPPDFLLIYHAMRLFCFNFPHRPTVLCDNPEIFKWLLQGGGGKHISRHFSTMVILTRNFWQMQFYRVMQKLHSGFKVIPKKLSFLEIKYWFHGQSYLLHISAAWIMFELWLNHKWMKFGPLLGLE